MLWVGLVVAACGWIGWRVERRWVDNRDRPSAVLAVVVVGLTAVTSIGQLLTAVGLLTGPAVLVATAVLVAVTWATCRRGGAGEDDGEDAGEDGGGGDGAVTSAVAMPESAPGPGAASRVDLVDLVVLTGALAAVAAQWTAHLGDAYARGMVHADNLWYHGPFSARILQTAGVGSLAPFGYPESRYFPLNTHVLDAMLMLPTRTDAFVPLVNHLAAALLLFAAWVCGRRYGAAALATLVVLVVLSLPLVGSTQPGQMYNDVAAIALLVAGVGMLLAAEPAASASRHRGGASVGTGRVDGTPGRGGTIGAARAPETVVAFAAFGWALSTKLSVAVPLGVVVVGVIVCLVRARRWRVALAAAGTLLVTGGVWFVRNLAVARSPMPYADLRVGPIGFEQQVPTTGATLLSTLGDPGRWSRYYAESLDVSFGPLWIVVVAGAIAGAVAASVRERGATRLVALAALAGVAAFPVMPTTGELPFVNNLRYGLASLVLGVLVGALTIARHRRARYAATATAAVVIVADLVSPHRGRVPAWPDQVWWAVAGAVLAAAVVTAPHGWWRLAPRGRRPALVAAVAACAAVAAAALVMPAAERAYLDGRYAGDGLDDAVLYGAIPDGPPVRVDVLGSIETYPFFGAHVGNEVAMWNDELAGVGGCREVRTWMSDDLADGIDAGYVVVGSAWLLRQVTPDERGEWFGTDPSVTVVFDDGTEAVYLRTGPLDPDACP